MGASRRSGPPVYIAAPLPPPPNPLHAAGGRPHVTDGARLQENKAFGKGWAVLRLAGCDQPAERGRAANWHARFRRDPFSGPVLQGATAALACPNKAGAKGGACATLHHRHRPCPQQAKGGPAGSGQPTSQYIAGPMYPQIDPADTHKKCDRNRKTQNIGF